MPVLSTQRGTRTLRKPSVSAKVVKSFPQMTSNNYIKIGKLDQELRIFS